MSFIFALINSPHVTLSEGTTANIQIVLRFVHFVAGITWVGLLYFFNLVNIPFLQKVDASTRSKVVPALMPGALWCFRWASVVTVLPEIWYWIMIMGTDARNAQTIAGKPIGPV